MKSLRKDPDILALTADKESCTIILDKYDCIQKVNYIPVEGITEGKDAEATGDIYSNLKPFPDFLCRNSYNHENYKDMRAISNRPGRFFCNSKDS